MLWAFQQISDHYMRPRWTVADGPLRLSASDLKEKSGWLKNLKSIVAGVGHQAELVHINGLLSFQKAGSGLSQKDDEGHKQTLDAVDSSGT